VTDDPLAGDRDWPPIVPMNNDEVIEFDGIRALMRMSPRRRRLVLGVILAASAIVWLVEISATPANLAPVPPRLENDIETIEQTLVNSDSPAGPALNDATDSAAPEAARRAACRRTPNPAVVSRTPGRLVFRTSPERAASRRIDRRPLDAVELGEPRRDPLEERGRRKCRLVQRREELSSVDLPQLRLTGRPYGRGSRNALQQTDLTEPIVGIERGDSHVEGLPLDEGRALLQSLQDHAERSAPRYAHTWRPHDVLIWDNASVQHKASGDFPVGEPRNFWRYMIAGPAPVPMSRTSD
jgi:hypothetical protein